jgi:hypothetical protein
MPITSPRALRSSRTVVALVRTSLAVLMIGQLVRRRRWTARIVRDGLVTPFKQLEKAGAEQR